MRVQLLIRTAVVGTHVCVSVCVCVCVCVCLHGFARAVVYLYKCLSVELHACTTACACIDYWHPYVFVHLFGRRVVYV